MTRYAKSRDALERAKRLIPLASQTFSKAYNRWPAESPHFLSHGKGGRVWDVDGNEYVDSSYPLCCQTCLGTLIQMSTGLSRQQLGRGCSFSLPTLLESRPR